MANDYNISYSYQTGAEAPAAQPTKTAPASEDTALYAFIACERVSIPNSGVLLIHKYSDAQIIVASEVSAALHSCRVFRTLAEHVKELTSTIPQLAGQDVDVAKVLQMLIDAGLMTTATSVCQRLTENVEPAADLSPTRIFIITCDRPAAVERLLQSMLHAGNLSRHEHLFIVDDSRDPKNAELNRELAARFNLTSPKDIHYVGAEAQQQLMDDLIAELPKHEEGIRFLIDRKRWADKKTYGLARTMCLLLSVGCRAIVMDDDVICAAVKSPHKGEGIELGDTARETDFYTSEADVVAKTTKEDFDPLNGHALCLGLSLGQALEKLGKPQLAEEDLKGSNAAYLSMWTANSPILITQSGTVGDPGTGSTSWIYGLQGASAQRMLATPEGLESALTNRHYWMGHPKPTFSKMAVISQVTGLDNSWNLPPYFPAFRGEDYLFGAMVEYLFPDSAVLEYDWSVPHFPLEARQGEASTEAPTNTESVNFSKLVTDRTRYDPHLSFSTRLNSLALSIKELAETSEAGLLTLLRQEVAQAQGKRVSNYVAQLQDGSQRPPKWQSYLENSLNLSTAALQQAMNPLDLVGIPEGYKKEQLLEEFKLYANTFSAALVAWPEVRSSSEKVINNYLGSSILVP